MEQPEKHDKLADQLEQEGDKMQERSAELGDEISDVRDDWQRKRADEGVPGAPPPQGEGSDESDEPEDADGPEDREDSEESDD